MLDYERFIGKDAMLVIVVAQYFQSSFFLLPTSWRYKSNNNWFLEKIRLIETTAKTYIEL